MPNNFWFFKNSVRWNCVALLNFRFKVWHVARKMIQNLTCCKTSDWKTDELFKVGLNFDLFWKFWFEVWRVVKKLFQNLIPYKSLHTKTVFFFHFFTNCWFLRNGITGKVGVFTGWKEPNWYSKRKAILKICFYTIQFHFKIWCFVKFFSRNLTQHKYFYSKFVELSKIGA